MPKLLQDRTAIITGGAQGIGFAIARMLAAHGANIVIGDVDGPHAEAAASDLGNGAIGVACDVVSAEAVSALIEAAVDTFGAVNISSISGKVGLVG